MDAGVGAGASLNRNLEPGVLPEAWMNFNFSQPVCPLFLGFVLELGE